MQECGLWHLKLMANLAYLPDTQAPQVFLGIKILELFVFWRVQNKLRATLSFVRIDMTHSQPYLLNATQYSIFQRFSSPSLLHNSLVSPAYLNTEIFLFLHTAGSLAR